LTTTTTLLHDKPNGAAAAVPLRAGGGRTLHPPPAPLKPDKRNKTLMELAQDGKAFKERKTKRRLFYLLGKAIWLYHNSHGAYC